MIKRSYLFLPAVLLLLLQSCTSYKSIPYFQNLKKKGPVEETIKNYSPLTIQPSDLLRVSVSSLNSQAYNDTSQQATGYLVDQEGQIKIPIVGKVKVSGLTTPEASDVIQQLLTKYLREPSVNVSMLNFKVAVLGDVARPNVYPVPNERITVTEALSMAGDLNITAKRKDLLLIRETDGKREYIPLDLTNVNLFNSPYYYLKSNDVLYIQPDKTKFAAVDNSYRFLSLLLSAASIVTVILTR